LLTIPDKQVFRDSYRIGMLYLVDHPVKRFPLSGFSPPHREVSTNKNPLSITFISVIQPT